MKTLIIIPAYNEAENIVNVVQSLNTENAEWDILVVNDCSEDDTGPLAETTGSYVVNLPCNLGIGGAVQTGFKYGARNQYDFAVKFDGDGQHKATEVKILLKDVIDENADVVIGSRFLEKNSGYKSTFLRRIGIKIFQVVNSILIKQKITDNTSGFRAYNKKAIKFLSEHYPSFDYPEPEEVILLGRNGFVIKETPTEMLQRQGGKSSICMKKSVYYMIKVLLAVFMTALRPKLVK